LEITVGASDPVTAADRQVLVRQTIQAVAQAHGSQASFAPVVVSGVVGNGAHLHFSPWSPGRNLFAGGDGPYGMSLAGESVLAGILERMRALAAIGCPSPASYLRLVPQRWAGPYQAWGRENREVGLRLVTGTVGEREQVANAELKCVDGSANPYLVAGAVCAVAANAAFAGLKLPEEVLADPSTLPTDAQPPRLPQGLPEAIDALAGDQLLTESMGGPLLEAFVAVRRAEHALFVYASPDAIAEATRWRY
jgi:glutamine synthetase